MLALIIQTIKKNKGSIIGYVLGSILVAWMYVAIYPSIAQQKDALTQYMASFPQDVFKAFGFDIQSFLTSLEGYLGGEHFSLIWPIMLIILATSFGAGALAGEIEQGTIGILLAQPLSRIKLFLGKYLAGLAVILTFVWTSVLAVIPLAALYRLDYQASHYFTMALIGSLFALAIFSFAMMLSSLFAERGKVTLLTTILLIAMYVLRVLSSLKASLGDLKYLSFFHYFNYNRALLENKIDLSAIVVFGGVILVCTLVGLVYFNRRDIATS